MCKQMIGFYSMWGKADKAQRHAILKEMFEAVYVDTDLKCIVGVKPYAEFVPLFQQTQLVERNHCFVLENGEAALNGSSIGRLAVSGGSDGIRTRDLCLDRAAC